MSEHVSDKKVTINSYIPDQAGQQVGWVSVAPKEDVGQFNVRTVEVNVGVASVSEKGAKIGYTERIENGEKRQIIFPGDVSGFVAVSALRLEIVRGMSAKEAVTMRPIDLAAAKHEREASPKVASAREIDDVVWCENGAMLMGAVKIGLFKQDVGDYYPAVYYGLNTAIGHAGVRAYLHQFASPDQLAPFVADPTMQGITDGQIEAAEAIVENLALIKDEDSRMKDNLTVFSGIPANRVADVFMGSRYAVHKAEARAVDIANTKLLLPYYAFLAAGFRTAGRTWPYMDATLDFENKKAFGVELAALRKQNVVPAEKELRREIDETTKRLEYTQAAVQMLRGLLAAEKLAT